jgi:hypothetical protein
MALWSLKQIHAKGPSAGGALQIFQFTIQWNAWYEIERKEGT